MEETKDGISLGDVPNSKLYEHQVNAGRNGGLSRSEAKRAAVRENLKKARLSRWKGREAAAKATQEAIDKLIGGVSGQEKVSKLGSEDGGSVRCCASDASGSGTEGPTAPSARKPDATSETRGTPAGGSSPYGDGDGGDL